MTGQRHWPSHTRSLWVFSAPSGCAGGKCQLHVSLYHAAGRLASAHGHFPGGRLTDTGQGTRGHLWPEAWQACARGGEGAPACPPALEGAGAAGWKGLQHTLPGLDGQPAWTWPPTTTVSLTCTSGQASSPVLPQDLCLSLTSPGTLLPFPSTRWYLQPYACRPSSRLYSCFSSVHKLPKAGSVCFLLCCSCSQHLPQDLCTSYPPCLNCFSLRTCITSSWRLTP